VHHQSAWRTKPRWFLITTEDKMIPTDAQRAMSKREGSNSGSEVKSRTPCMCRIHKSVDRIIEEAAKRWHGSRERRRNECCPQIRLE